MNQGEAAMIDEEGSSRTDEDNLLLEEANHRTANEVAAAIAAVRLARGAKTPDARLRLLDTAISRLEGFGDCCRLLAAPAAHSTDAGEMLDRLCRSLLTSRNSGGPDTVVLGISPVAAPGETARRIAMVAHEIITNALKHAFREPGGTLEVRLEPRAGAIVLSVLDDGPGTIREAQAAAPRGGLGSGIVARLVTAGGGLINCDTGPRGTAVHVTFPMPTTNRSAERHA